MRQRTTRPDCICDGRTPWCAVCVVAVTALMAADHQDSLSPFMLKRRLGQSITGREASLLVEFARRLPAPSPAHEANRNGKRYVERP